MGRKKARDNAFKCIYQLSFNSNSLDKIIFNCYEENQNEDDEKEYIEKVVRGVNQNIDKIDEIILSKLKNWTIDRISKIDLAILRLAIYEIMFLDDVPMKVSANEAVEIAKTYGNNNSKSFVNGVLAKIIEENNK